MHAYDATIAWNRGDAAFTDNRYSRAHTWRFDGGAIVPASSSPSIVPEPMSVAANVDPEEALVAAVSSCHMLFFLSFAAKQGFVVDSYHDQARGVMEKNGAGKLVMARITLRPEVVFDGKTPDPRQLRELHHRSHEECFIANSIRTEIVLELPT